MHVRHDNGRAEGQQDGLLEGALCLPRLGIIRPRLEPLACGGVLGGGASPEDSLERLHGLLYEAVVVAGEVVEEAA